jgi:Family of unknown function (DUF5522)/Cysteine-rich CWC
MRNYSPCRQKGIYNMESSQKICPRCRKEFICNSENIAACACSKITISNGTRSFLANTFYRCLCNDCLTELNQLVEKEKQYPFPGRGGDLIEGIHYYNEDVYRVFTEFYLLSRGFCCRSGCRHCPYGFKKRWAE